MNRPSGHRTRIAIVAAVAVMALLAGCASHPSEGAPTGVEAQAQLESEVLAATDIATGVYVSQTSSGAGNDVIQVRLYVTTDELAALAGAVDGALETAWRSWVRRPSVIKLGVVVGPKPADVGTADANIRDLEDVAVELGISPKAVRVNITLTAADLEQRYGAWSAPANG